METVVIEKNRNECPMRCRSGALHQFARRRDCGVCKNFGVWRCRVGNRMVVGCQAKFPSQHCTCQAVLIVLNKTCSKDYESPDIAGGYILAGQSKRAYAQIPSCTLCWRISIRENFSVVERNRVDARAATAGALVPRL